MTARNEIQLSFVDPSEGRAVDFVLTAEPETPMRDVLRVLSQIRPGNLWVEEWSLRPVGTLAESPLKDGAIISVGQPLGRPSQRGLELCVVSGPATGMRIPLQRGKNMVGTGSHADARIPDAGLDQEHFTVIVGNKGFLVEPADTKRATFVDGKRVRDRAPVEQREAIRAGASVFEVRVAPRPDADISVNDEGSLVFNRPARIKPADSEQSFQFPSKPAKVRKTRVPWLMILSPMLMAVVMVTILKSYYFLAFGLLSPIIAYGNYRMNRKDQKTNYEDEVAEYEQKLEDVYARIEKARRIQAIGARFTFPDAVGIYDFAVTRRRRIWERRLADDDYLSIRIGSGTQPARMTLNGGREERQPEVNLYELPTTVNLRTLGVLGIAGPLGQSRGVARWIVAQLAVLHSPNDLRMVILGQNETEREWAWTRWLPHVRTEEAVGAPFTSIATDRYSREEQIKWLLRTMTQRKTAVDNDEPIGQDIVVVLDGARALRDTAGVARILRDGPSMKIYAIAIDSEVSRLPEEGKAAIALRGLNASLGVLRVEGQNDIENIVIEQLSSALAEQIARGISPLVEAGRAEADRELPDSLRLVDLLEMKLDDPRDIIDRWRQNGRTTAAPVGASPGGTFVLDLKKDGPHGLVAGTTGAGKSEFLQTVVASLAIANRPDALNFLLVDYKGASAFANCSELPHTVGMVTNLDGHLTQRALTALEAELHRRERELSAMKATDVDNAWRQNPQLAAERGLARLIIVIDEFAELVQELPDFVPGLIRVARVGRSLGVHLILATQRPTGVVSAEMKANTGLRVALRVEDRGESSEVLDEGDAAYISRRTPGRGYARLGGGTALTPFQTARVAGRRKGVSIGLPPPVITMVPDHQLSRALPSVRSNEELEEETTDLSAIVNDINAAARMVKMPAPHAPWLPPLEEKLVLDVLNQDAPVYGQEDRPREQSQPMRMFDIEHGGHLLIVGSARSGRSTALRTIATSVAAHYAPGDVHIYGFDFGNGSLLPLSKFAHTGAIVQRLQRGRTERLLRRLIEEISARQQLLSRFGMGDISEQRASAAPEDRLPYALVLIDRWEGFQAEYTVDSGSELPDLIGRILREGPGVGVRVIITGDRSLMLDRISTQVETRIALKLSDRDDYALVGMNRKDAPTDLPPGRGIITPGLTDLQFGLLTEDPTAAAQNAVVFAVAAESHTRLIDGAPMPLRVDELPTAIRYADAIAMGTSLEAGPLRPLIGVGGDALAAIRIDLEQEGPFCFVAGPPKSGRSTALAMIAQDSLAHGGRVAVITPRRSVLAEIADHPNLYKLGNGQEHGTKLVDLMNEPGPLLVLVDDASLISGSEIDDVIRQSVRMGRPHTAVMHAGMAEELRLELRGSIVDARKSRVGLLLAPQSILDGDIVGKRLEKGMLGAANAGRGVFIHNGEASLVQVPIAD